MPGFACFFNLAVDVISKFKPSQLKSPIRRVGPRSMDKLPEAQYQDEFYRSMGTFVSPLSLRLQRWVKLVSCSCELFRSTLNRRRYFSVLRHVLRALYRFPLFALFLSTTGKISQFTSPNEDTSKRIIIGDLTLIQPFTDFGFDTLAKEVAIVALDGHWNLKRVTADSHIVHMGRPL